VVGKFHTYVKPTIEPQITEFCTELTGIHNDTVFGILNGEKVKDIPTIE
jgi:inhibitor of KinA sporulation pathway (predicted exonuclease)